MGVFLGSEGVRGVQARAPPLRVACGPHEGVGEGGQVLCICFRMSGVTVRFCVLLVQSFVVVSPSFCFVGSVRMLQCCHFLLLTFSSVARGRESWSVRVPRAIPGSSATAPGNCTAHRSEYKRRPCSVALAFRNAAALVSGGRLSAVGGTEGVWESCAKESGSRDSGLIAKAHDHASGRRADQPHQPNQHQHQHLAPRLDRPSSPPPRTPPFDRSSANRPETRPLPRLAYLIDCLGIAPRSLGPTPAHSLGLVQVVWTTCRT